MTLSGIVHGATFSHNLPVFQAAPIQVDLYLMQHYKKTLRVGNSHLVA